VLRQAHRAARRVRRSARGQRLLDRAPLRWYERHRKRPTRAARVVWGVFTAFALVGTAASLYYQVGGTRPEIAMMVNLLQAAVGLLLVTVGASTALAEERGRGSLDILLATPVPTRAIVWAKWRSAFAVVPKVLSLPLLVILAAWMTAGTSMMFGQQRRDADIDFVALVLAVVLLVTTGAMLVSLGLCVATYVRSFARAVGLAVGLYVVITIGWVFVAFMISSRGEWMFAMLMGSPMYAAGLLVQYFVFPLPGDLGRNLLIGIVGWSVVYGGMAVGLYFAARAAFDRKLGRVTLTKPRCDRSLGVRHRPQPALAAAAGDVVD
jgi:ABC-type transport system involved in multi-copper enzyme maturation permease subunit